MAKLVCNCGDVLLTLPGGVRVEIDPGFSMSDLVCPSCSETGWTFQDGMRIVDAGVTYEYAGQATMDTDNGKANIFACSCDTSNLLLHGPIGVKFIEVPEITEESVVNCCGCAADMLFVPAGYRLLLESDGEIATKLPRPLPEHSDWTFF